MVGGWSVRRKEEVRKWVPSGSMRTVSTAHLLYEPGYNTLYVGKLTEETSRVTRPTYEFPTGV
jgi:arylsulfatase A-like enzyme